MSDQFENQSVVGEDGELLKPDTSVDPDAYAEFVATYVHRDPLWFRVQEHFRERRIGYQVAFLPFYCAFIALLPVLFLLFSGHIDLEANRDALIQLLIIVVLVATVPIALIYIVLRADTRE